MSRRNRKRVLDGPKTAAKYKAIKEATSRLKQQYDTRQKQPDRDSPVEYATHQVEDAGRGVGMFAAKAVGQMVKRAKRKGREGVEASSPCEPDPVQRGQEHFLQKRREQKANNNRLGQSSPIGGETPHNGGYGPHNSYPQSSIQGGKPQEHNAKRTIQGAKKSHQKAGELAEKRIFHPGRGKADSHSFFKRPSAGIKKGKTIPGQGNVPTSIHKIATQRAKQMAQRKAQRKMLAQTVAKAKPVAKAGGQLLVRSAVMIGRAAASAIGSIVAAGGGVMFLMMLLLVVAIGGLAASPFGILLSGENQTPDTVPVSAAVARVQYDLNGQLELLQSGDNYNNVIIHGSTPNWADVLAVFAVKVAGSNSPDATDVVSIDAARIEKLKAVFWDMCALSHHVEVIDHPDSDPSDGVNDSWTEKILNITITAKTAQDVSTAYGFTPQQVSMLNELLTCRELLVELPGDLSAISSHTSEILRKLPEDLSPDRRAVVRAACSLVGKLNYFWGGKSNAIGWDDRWGTLQCVTAQGSPTTGTYRPYGMDCSGCATRS